MPKVVLLPFFARALFIFIFCLCTAVTFMYLAKGQLINYVFLWCVDVAAEKTQQALLKGVEGFDTNNLKPTETQEKVVLPDNEGEFGNFWGKMAMNIF